MKTVTYGQIKSAAFLLAERESGKFPSGEVSLLRPVLAAELRRMWEREAWPELCDHLEEVTLDANKCFDTREGDANEMGLIISVLEGGDPRTTDSIQPVQSWTRLNDRVHVVGTEAAVWVDWMTVAPNLMASAYNTEAALDAVEIPERFEYPLALLGGARLIDLENPIRAGQYRAEAKAILAEQAADIKSPWWRMGRAK